MRNKRPLFKAFKIIRRKNGEEIIVPTLIWDRNLNDYIENGIGLHYTFHKSGEVHLKDNNGDIYIKSNWKPEVIIRQFIVNQINQIQHYFINSIIQRYFLDPINKSHNTG